MHVRGRIFFIFLLLALASWINCLADDNPYEDGDDFEAPGKSSRGSIVVANRGSGSISIIDTRNNLLAGEVMLPAAANFPEPMYVVHSGSVNNLSHIFLAVAQSGR